MIKNYNLSVNDVEFIKKHDWCNTKPNNQKGGGGLDRLAPLAVCKNWDCPVHKIYIERERRERERERDWKKSSL
jgi:hypothetical protein